MGRIRPHEKAILFTACLYADQEVYTKALPLLIKHFGSVLYESPSRLWNFSSYYERELGSPLLRSFVYFEPYIDPSCLAEAKRFTNDLEQELSGDGPRKINLDPGYLTLAKVVLASTKNYSHRIYLGKGIYGDLTLYFQDEMFTPMPFTYHEYRDRECIEVFLHARKLLKDRGLS